ncbi:uncharacterized protein LOC131329482 [Rhododendron vialii]|uniref:uncharacterized protein LOC131329482 n=1 Tax=Rhododendron vialii TaxID=182163 RepID=UPI00265DCF6D|nr:uncharacterized protein LOC131329482 [Rhododendron vialii]
MCWGEVGERKLVSEKEFLGPELVKVTIDKVKVIQEQLKVAQSRQKSYADTRRRDLEFNVGDQVFVRVSPWKGRLRFGKKVELKDDMTYVEQPVQTLDHKEQVLCNKTIPLVKVLWRSRSTEYATWEAEINIWKQYPHLFGQGHAI